MATLKQVSKEIEQELKVTSQVGRKVASDLHSITLDRIFTKGIASDGSKIGKYTPTTIRIKKSKNRFTSDTVNFRDTETLVNSYTVQFTRKGANIGFRSATRDGVSNKEKVRKLEEQYGDVFDLTSSEDREIDNIIDDFLDKIYR